MGRGRPRSRPGSSRTGRAGLTAEVGRLAAERADRAARAEVMADMEALTEDPAGWSGPEAVDDPGAAAEASSGAPSREGRSAL